MPTYIAYTRVSTTRQVQGASLAEQRAAIERYAAARGLHISQWLEEVQTSASCRRLVFQNIMRLLQNGPDLGLILHKVDRGVRNLKDWAALGELIDRGVDVRFAHDDLDLETRGGRLTADIQAVIAADYIRNLREEVRNGMYGRLEQGLYPFQAPLGYLDRGQGRVKTPDPIMAPLVIHAFRAYATGEYTLSALSREVYTLGLARRTSHCHPRQFQTCSIAPSMSAPAGWEESNAKASTNRSSRASCSTLCRAYCRLQRRRLGRCSRHAFRYARRLECQTCSRSLTGVPPCTQSRAARS